MISDAEVRAGSLSFRALKLFESIGRVGSVRRASEECALSQPAVTQALAKLEEQIGLTLVERRANGSFLNGAGQIFHARVRRFFDQVEAALVELGVSGGAPTVRSAARRLSRSQARALVALAERRSFAASSERLGISEASLQRAVRDLQSDLCKPLFYRTAAGVVVTPAGMLLGRQVKLAMQEIVWGVQEVQSAAGAVSSQIVIGAMPFGGSVLLASVLDDFLHAHSGADVRIVTGSAAKMLEGLQGGDADLVVGLLPEQPATDLTPLPLAETPYSIVGRRGHPLLQKGRVGLEELLRYEWVVGNEGASRRACFDDLFAGCGQPQASIMTCSLPIVRQLLLRSDRLTLMTSYELFHEGEGLAEIKYGPIALTPVIGITMRVNWKPTPLHQDFIDLVRHHMEAAAQPYLREAG